MLDGVITALEFETKINELFGKEGAIILDPFMKLMEYMDYTGFLESENFLRIKANFDNYINSPVRPNICAGSSYPIDKAELEESLDNLFATVSPENVKKGALGAVAPHIDFRIGEGAHKAYASAYHSLRDSDPELIVIIGTSHYGNSGRFMFTKKDYETPLGIIKTDADILFELNREMPQDIVFDEIAHRNEHSIELQAVLCQRYFRSREFKILPILAGSFHDYMAAGNKPSNDMKFVEFIDKLKHIIESQNKKAIFIASADFAHVGRKFQDNFDAEKILDVLEIEDKILIESLEKCDADEFFFTISTVKDKNKICGISPIYTLLNLIKPKYGKILSYYQWDETETKSAVSFASIAFY
jgi:AmmeMemoRadiSam system protein B